ncbi:unnamed protein product [Penicillium salamii]|uniref:Protein farnesyltransferase subunit beta n=1 Tax=Penicillium salamii TaxID=1612424 RepID=A0A9W4JUY7_9EURO|nr:unnamed protein product [Penicillium salamii]CAG8340631.1 unnamed protein product [Penicillium salamii]CAG8421426.1 unnamed protein product [Penicillium salamii]
MPLIGRRRVRFPNPNPVSQSQKPKKKMTRPGIPAIFTQPPAIIDPLITETTDLHNATRDKCLPFLKGTHSSQADLNQHGVPALKRDLHVGYLYDSLEDYPSGFVAMDASRPWMVYWGLAGLAMLGEDTSRFRERVIATLRPMQNPSGGFGGGHGQTSHLAGSYAAVLSLAMVGGEGLALVDRHAMWQWLSRVKQPDGGFRVGEGGEEDVRFVKQRGWLGFDFLTFRRGAYCAMTIISLLDLPLALADGQARDAGLETLTSGLPQYLSRCQTFEGGISGSPGSEAHGAYAFCALACLAIMGPPEEVFTRHMDIPMLVSWLSARQSAPEGGLSGRTNKLVDGCYSHWVGGCWPLLESSLEGKPGSTEPPASSLFSREGLTRYILACCQGNDGGLRDKPGKHVDSYHTCYVLAGLSATQTHHYRTDSSAVSDGFSSAFSWKSSPSHAEDNVFSKSDRLTPLHPLYLIPHKDAERMRLWSQDHPLV